MIHRTFKRRSVLQGLGHAATFGSLAAALPHIARAGQAPAATAPAQKVVVTMLYPSGEGLKFDADAFRDRHIGIIKAAYGPAVERVELRVAPPPPPPPVVAEGQTPPPPPPTPPLLAAVSMWLGNIGEFVRRAPEAAKTVTPDMAKITNSAPMVQYDVVESTAGDPPGSVLGGSTVVSMYFFAKDGGTWNKDYFNKASPKVMEAYGAAAIQRAEVQRGEIAPANGKVLVTGAIHLYIKDATAFDAAIGSDAVKALGAEMAQNTTLQPVTLLMSVHATG
jgi:hypothetical protein